VDTEPGLNMKRLANDHHVKGRTVQQAHEGGKMGWEVPKSTQDFFTDIRKPLIRSTALQVLDHCPRKFLYEYKLGIHPRRYESALTVGSIVHKVLQSMFMGQPATEALATCQSVLAKEQHKLIDSAGPSGFLPGGQSIEASIKRMQEDYHKAAAMALAFWQFEPFPFDQYDILRTPDGDPVVEMILDCKIPGASRPVRTPCDLALVDRETGGIWIVDYKTTSLDPKLRAIPTRISAQLALYRLGLQVHLDKWDADSDTKRRVVGSIHAIIRKPTIKYCGKDANFDAYLDRVVQWYKDSKAKNPDNPPILLDANRFSGPTLTSELYGRLRQYCRAAWASPNISHFYRAGDSACLQYNRVCPFMALCSSSPVQWPSLIEERYELSFREDEETHDQD